MASATDSPAPVSLEFIGRSLDTVQADQADLRRRMIALGERFGTVETRIGGIEARIGSIEGRMTGIENRMTAFEERMDLMIEQIGKTEANTGCALLLIERLATAQGLGGAG